MDCPTGSLSVSLGACNPDGSRDVTLTANIATVPPNTTVVGNWDFGDSTFGAGVNVTGPGAYAVTHPYKPTPGTWFARFYWIVPPEICSPFTAEVSIPEACPVLCPTYDVLIRHSNPSEQCFDRKRELVFNATFVGQLQPGHPNAYFWDFGDNTTSSGSSPQIQPQPEIHLYPAPGSPQHVTQYTAKFIVLDFQGLCRATFSSVVKVPGCGPEEEGTGCKALRWAAVIAAIMAAIALYICVCVKVPGAQYFCYAAAILGLLSAVLFAIWYFCDTKPCGAALLIAWQIALGTGIGALYFASCPGCEYLWIVGFGLIASAIALFIIWIRRCRLPWCQVLAELGVVITIVVIPVLGWLLNIPFLKECANPYVNTAVGLLSLGVGIGLVNCASKAPEPQGPM